MNELDQQIIDELRKLEIQITKELGEIRATIDRNGERASAEHRSLKETVERNIKSDTHRLNTHSGELDNLQERLTIIEEWRKAQTEKQESIDKKITNRITLFGGAFAIIAVIVAFFLDKL